MLLVKESRPGPSKCFGCFQLGHLSNECSNRKQLQLVEGDLEPNSDLSFPTNTEELEDVLGDEGKFISCILEKVLLVSR